MKITSTTPQLLPTHSSLHTLHIQDCPSQATVIPLTVKQALDWNPWVKSKSEDILTDLISGKHSPQFTALVTLFSWSSMAVVAEVVAPTPSVSFQIESQNIRNMERELMTALRIPG